MSKNTKIAAMMLAIASMGNVVPAPKAQPTAAITSTGGTNWSAVGASALLVGVGAFAYRKLQKSIGAMQKDVGAIQKDVDVIQKDVRAVKADVENHQVSLEESMKTTEAASEAIQENIRARDVLKKDIQQEISSLRADFERQYLLITDANNKLITDANKQFLRRSDFNAEGKLIKAASKSV